MFPEAVSNASSPNLPIEVQSPVGNDPWYQVTQSKTAAGLEEIAEIQTARGTEMARADVRHGQLATWNDISERLRSGGRRR
jgi:hypothetical protein